ncbi:polysaccharide deacetylase family protein [Actinoplanes sp. LDG1-06]|uniref:Polysaccharide deacetylase family protein n=1 Tax=Paractinoplanes ovalisporus TaxID=2810368 RepID=A0ABS2A541_9ACTN|nr:polysaccharide deacetylase family protein [Actinoplanes ovalisporus]MBM2614840.1 polysaccharide deacetylase family protein [Actinoplanes ovalisporus]
MRFSKPLLSAGVAAVALGAFALSSVGAEAATIKPAAVVTALPAAKSGKAAPTGGTAKTLVLYDTTGDYGWMGEVYATQTANLSSHFGSWTAAPVGAYKTGDLNAYTAVIYVGSTYDEPIPAAFLTDVAATTKPVTWMFDNIWQLTATGRFAAEHGFTSGGFDFADVAEVDYKGQKLTRDTTNKSGIMNLSITDASKVKTLATAVRPDGSSFPWAVSSGNFTYVGEIPFSYVTHDDRYLAFADLLFDSLGDTGVTADRHRGLVRIEDVGPDSDPDELKAVADYLSSEKVPFTVAVYPRYRDPKGVNNGGKAQDYTLLSKPKVVAALKYMQSKGGTLLMHGYTHQYGNVANPYDGVSANDFEFYTAHVDANDSVIYDGPVAGDSAAWATGRMLASGLVFAAAGLGTPTIFEFPHYAASAADYQAVNTLFGKRYDRGLYFPGVLSGGKLDYSRQFGQFFPYVVRDVYGSVVVPENIGNIEPEAFNNHPARVSSDLIASAERNLAIRDGVASFFYHPYLGTDYLKQVVTGVKAEGYTFVSANTMLTTK